MGVTLALGLLAYSARACWTLKPRSRSSLSDPPATTPETAEDLLSRFPGHFLANLPKPPRIDRRLFSEAEQDEIRGGETLLDGLQSYVRAFSPALELFDMCEYAPGHCLGPKSLCRVTSDVACREANAEPPPQHREPAECARASPPSQGLMRASSGPSERSATSVSCTA